MDEWMFEIIPVEIPGRLYEKQMGNLVEALLQIDETLFPAECKRLPETSEVA